MKIVDGKVVQDDGETTVKFEEEEPEVEEQFVREGEEEPDPDAALPEEVKKKSKTELVKEIEAARAQAKPADAGEQVASALEKLAQKLTPAEREVVTQAPTETDEQFAERLSVELFDKTTVTKSLRDAVLRVVGPLLAQQNTQSYQTTLKLMRLDPENGAAFRKYESEVLAYVKSHFKGYETSPQALEMAFSQVRLAHIDDIVKERAQVLVEEEKKKGAGATAKEREPLGLERGGAGGRQTVKRTFTITKVDVEEAENRGVSPEAIARARARRMSGR